MTMEVRSLEAVFCFTFDAKKLNEAIKQINKFADVVNSTVNGMVDKIAIEAGIDQAKIKEAKKSVQKLADDIGNKVNNLNKNIAIKPRIDKKKLKQTENQIQKFTSNVEKMFTIGASYFAVQGVASFFTNTMESAANVGRISTYLGITTNALEEMRYAAQKSGITIDTLDDSLKELQVRAMDAKSGTGEAAEAFSMLGMKSTDAAGNIREPLELLDEVADRLKTLPTQSDRLWVLDSLLGDQGVEMLKMLDIGSEGIKNLRAEAKALGVSLSKEDANSAKQFTEEMIKLKTSVEMLIRPIMLSLLPALKKFSDFAQRLGKTLSQLLGDINVLEPALAILAGTLGAIAVKASIAFAPFFAIGAAVAATIWLINDMWHAFSDGNSVLLRLHKRAREFFEPIEQWLMSLPKKIWDGFVGGIKAAFDWIFQKIREIENLIPDSFKSYFKNSSHSVHVKNEYGIFNHRKLAPQVSSLSHHNINNNNQKQSVSVAVNVASTSSPNLIGSELAKAVRKELEKDRLNTFMGLSHAY